MVPSALVSGAADVVGGSSPTMACGGGGVVLAAAEKSMMTQRRKRGRPREALGACMHLVPGVAAEEVAEIPMVQVWSEEGSPLILPEARGVVGALTRVRRDFLIAKQAGIVIIGSEEEAIQSFADNLIATHPRLYGFS